MHSQTSRRQPQRNFEITLSYDEGLQMNSLWASDLSICYLTTGLTAAKGHCHQRGWLDKLRGPTGTVLQLRSAASSATK